MDFLTKNNELKDWEEIRNVLKIYTPYEENNQAVINRGNKLLFGRNELDDIDYILNMKDNENNFKEENENDESGDSDKSDKSDIEENESENSFEDECFII